jgi:hypothetical protein
MKYFLTLLTENASELAKKAALLASVLRKRYPTAKEIESL